MGDWGNPARPPHDTSLSFLWRLLATRAKRVLTLIDFSAASTADSHLIRPDSLIASQLRRSFGAIRSFQGRSAASSSDSQALECWIKSLVCRCAQGDRQRIAALASSALKEAETLQRKERKKEDYAWKLWLRGQHHTLSTGLSPPMKRAFRFVRGPVGWTPSPSGCSAMEEGIPHDAADCFDEADALGSLENTLPDDWNCQIVGNLNSLAPLGPQAAAE